MKIHPTLVSLVLILAALPAHAQISLGVPDNFAGFSSRDIRETISNIVRIVIGFLGILMVVAIIFGGFRIMTSFGDAEKNGSGRKIVAAGLIGLVILLAAYAIANFVINNLQQAI